VTSHSRPPPPPPQQQQQQQQQGRLLHQWRLHCRLSSSSNQCQLLQSWLRSSQQKQHTLLLRQ
jgi:invasion protein IalB